MLIVEDGSGIPNATSYVTLTEYQDWCAARAVTLGTEAESEAQLIRAFDWLSVQAWAKPWPAFDGAIPKAVLTAQIELARVIAGGFDPFAINTGERVTEETVDVLTVRYDTSKSKVGTDLQSTAPSIYQRIKPYLSSSNAGYIDRA